MDTPTNSQPITKQDWDELVTILQQSFGDVHTEIQSVKGELNQKITALDNKVAALDNKVAMLADTVVSVRSEVLDSNEHIATEISDMREEQIAILGGRKRVNDTLLEHGDHLQEHDRRIEVLETSINLR